MAHIDFVTGTATTFPLTGNDATATYEDDSLFAGSAAYASSDDIEAQYDHDDAEDESEEDEDEEYEVSEDIDDEEDEDEEDVDDEDEDDEDAVAEDDEEDEEVEDGKVTA